MRFIKIIFCALLVFSAGSALAEVKMPDHREAAAPAAKALQTPLNGTLSESSGIYDRIYTNGSVSTNCGATAFDSVNDGMYYDIHCFQTDSYEPIELIVDLNGTDIIDTVLTIYCNPFDPSNPDQNVVAYDDDGGVGTLSAITLDMNVILHPGTEYWIVVSSYGANMTGDYELQRGGNVYDCGVVSNVNASWGAIKGMYR